MCGAPTVQQRNSSKCNLQPAIKNSGPVSTYFSIRAYKIKTTGQLNKRTFSAASSTNLSSKQQIFLGNLLSDNSFLVGIFMNESFQGLNLFSIILYYILINVWCV
ncbi:hypothetical protein BgiBS90_028771 [Biomphalaria glabrata]|nr:hypothetical protein BgiBS90_028771 [Biomphalaria glabrata]